MASGPVRKGAGDRDLRAELQSGRSTTDSIRGRTMTWTTYARPWVAVDVTPVVVDETKATQVFVVTAPFDARTEKGHRALVQLRQGGTLTLKVLEVENPKLLSRDMRLHCVVDKAA